MDIEAKVLVSLGMAESRQPALMSLCPSPLLPNRHLFSLFSSLLRSALSICLHCHPARRLQQHQQRAAMQPLHSPPPQKGSMQQQMSPETPLTPSSEYWIPRGWLEWAGDGGHSPVWLVTGGRLSQYCSWMEAATGLSQRRNAWMGRQQAGAGLYVQYAVSPSPNASLGQS